MPAEQRPRVLMSYQAPPGGGNPYTRLLSSALEDRVEVAYFSISRGLFGRWDVLHVHWPETLVRSRTRLRTFVSLLAGFLLLGRLTLTRRPIVWTVHNQVSHEGGGFLERLFLRGLARRVRVRIFLNESAENDLSEGVVILHGSYEPVTDPLLSASAVDPLDRAYVQSDLLTFGVLRPYKGIDDLLASAHETNLVIRIEGRPVSMSYQDELERAAESLRNVSFAFGHRSDEDLISALVGTKAVVLPYKSMYNSGALLFALSSGVPVIAPMSAANIAIQEEVGAEWLYLYEGCLTAAVLEEANNALLTAERGTINLTRRNWAAAAYLHTRIYSECMRGDVDNVASRLHSDPEFAAHSPLNAFDGHAEQSRRKTS